MELFEEVEAEAYVYPTEDVEKVKRAMLNLIPDLEFEAFDKGGDHIILTGRTRSRKALSRLYELFRGQAILDTARSFLEEGYFGEEIIVRVNKQAAYAGGCELQRGEPARADNDNHKDEGPPREADEVARPPEDEGRRPGGVISRRKGAFFVFPRYGDFLGAENRGTVAGIERRARSGRGGSCEFRGCNKTR